MLKCETWSLRVLCIFSAEHGASRQVWKAAMPRIPKGPGRGTFMMCIALRRLNGCTEEWTSYQIAPRFRTCMLVRFERLTATSEMNSALGELLLTVAEWVMISRMKQRPPMITTSQPKNRGSFCYYSHHGI